MERSGRLTRLDLEEESGWSGWMERLDVAQKGPMRVAGKAEA